MTTHRRLPMLFEPLLQLLNKLKLTGMLAAFCSMSWPNATILASVSDCGSPRSRNLHASKISTPTSPRDISIRRCLARCETSAGSLDTSMS
jgi:hypothetical protein